MKSPAKPFGSPLFFQFSAIKRFVCFSVDGFGQILFGFRPAECQTILISNFFFFDPLFLFFVLAKIYDIRCHVTVGLNAFCGTNPATQQKPLACRRLERQAQQVFSFQNLLQMLPAKL